MAPAALVVDESRLEAAVAVESAGIAVADPFEDAVSFFLYTFF